MASQLQREQKLVQSLQQESLQPHLFKIIVDSQSDLVCEADRREYIKHYTRANEKSSTSQLLQVGALLGYIYAVGRYVSNPSTRKFSYGLAALLGSFSLLNPSKNLHHNHSLREIYSKYNISTNPQALEILKSRIY
uniref:NDUTT16 n=2 Tax=Tetrahymena thermophila (strain SB210) TaxID=312017 RepID=UPI00006CAE05|nr:Chain TG, NDUTT16 [Tetrahymena thermophila SB210]8GYM_tg Chain tg, NDUTT16 [Tetrahymena thermophila SB210]8GZU_TG Chain TG, NDUTT16 [Tetrahymena thermophila SB210]8GZU_tg Chain tg, NDUTT16 [Tetrahymena thermophila SB210]